MDFFFPQEIVKSFYTEALEVKDEVYQCYPSILRLDVMVSRMYDPAIPRRLLASALCALKAMGSKGVHTQLNSGDKFLVDFYSKLGFVTIPLADKSADTVYMGRLM